MLDISFRQKHAGDCTEAECFDILLKGIVHPQTILSLFTHPNLYAFLSSEENKRRYFEEHWGPKNIKSFDFYCMKEKTQTNFQNIFFYEPKKIVKFGTLG